MISAIVPVFNEIEALPVAIERLTQTLSAFTPDWEILVIESGSTDGTGELADAHAAADPRINVVHEGARKGFGSAIRRGLSEAKGERLWIVPVDLPFPLETLREALESRADAVISYRSYDPRGIARRLQSMVFNAMCRRLIGLRVRSINSAFKVYRRTAVADLSLRSSGWLIDAEILARLTANNAVVQEIPVPIIDRQLGVSKVGLFDGVRILIQLFQLRTVLKDANGG